MGDAAGTAEKERAAKMKEIFQQVVHALLKRVPDPQKDQLKEKVKNHVNKVPGASPDVFPHLFAVGSRCCVSDQVVPTVPVATTLTLVFPVRAEQLIKFCFALCTEHKFMDISGQLSIVVRSNEANQAARTSPPTHSAAPDHGCARNAPDTLTLAVPPTQGGKLLPQRGGQ